MYAVVDINSHQYIVKKWDKISVDNVKKWEWEKVDFSDVLACFDESWKDVKIGYPYIDWAKISTKVIDNFRDDKVNVVKFNGKKRYHKKQWFRAEKTVLQIESINI